LPYPINTASGTLWEFPLSTVRLGRWNLPVAGGGYFRLYPLGLTGRMLGRVNCSGNPFVFYVHPWELDSDQPRLRIGSLKSRFRHYVNLRSTEAKLDRLLGRFRFDTLCSAVHAARECRELNESRLSRTENCRTSDLLESPLVLEARN
jgi:hypothetical protein